MYEILTKDPIFSGTGDKVRLLERLQRGWRPDLSNITPLSRSIIERCWSFDPKERPSFEDIWRELYIGGFDIVAGVNRNDIDSFLTLIEGEGLKVD
jgi:hypothetical protein